MPKKTGKQFEFLPHTADARMRVWGKTRGELLRNAVLGLINYLKPTYGEEKISREIKVESLDFSTLLVDFLSEVLAQADLGNEAYEEVEIKELGEERMEAVLHGRKAKIFKDDIKAVTHHDLTVEKKDSRWEAVITFDI